MSGADPAVTARRVAPGGPSIGDFTYSVVVIEPPARTTPAGPARAASATEANAERRTDGRVRTRLRDATLAEGRGRVLMDCRIKDKSRRGARLQLDEDRPLPKVFLLSEPAGTCYRATLVWQDGREAGVRLVAGK